MYKLVVLFALVAAAVCEPGAILGGAYFNGAAPYSYGAPYLAPSSPYYGQAGYIPSNYYYSSPYYSAPAHFIKKRSASPEPEPSPSPSPSPSALFAYAPTYYPNTYLASAPLATSYSYSSSLLPGAPVLPVTYAAPAAHFIKKRSASPAASPAASPSASPSVAFPSTYYAPAAYPYAAASPLLTTSYSYGAAPYYASSPYYYGSGPFAYSTFIKK